MSRKRRSLFRGIQGGGREDGRRGISAYRAGRGGPGINEGTLGNWVNAYRREHPQEEKPLTPAERANMADLQAENRELRMELEFLKKAAAYFARE